MKTNLFLFIVLPHLVQVLTAFHVTRGYDVHVVNGLPDSPNPLWVHCASGNDDLGERILHENEDFHWHFRDGILGRTLFFCHFWWGSKQRSFEVFHNPEKCEFGYGRHDHNPCYWLVKPDGFYFSNLFPPPPSSLKKIYDWA
ncbi:Plant self-incompatibility protein S1 family [Abeliophyllum distichum]|uniref:S-protein homolog n=1 Tax=Abeliophyllum distichum TaxID=126358 RepID=A0ABD1Q032_9LAMI